MKTIIAKDKEHLITLIKDEILINGYKCNLNHIDTSNVTNVTNVTNVSNVSNLFRDSKFNGDISQWNVSNVNNMSFMFKDSQFNQDISNWNTSKVNSMAGMFWHASFNQDISQWNVSNIINMFRVFSENSLNKPWWAIPDNDSRKEAITKFNLMNKISNSLPSKDISQPSTKKLKI